MLDQGLIDEEAAARHPARNRIFSCLGGSHSPQIEFSSPVPLFSNDLMVMCTDGVWGNLTTEELVHRLDDANVLDASPALLDLAESKGGPGCDNLSMLAMRWHDDYAEELPAAVSTDSMTVDGITTKMEGFARGRGAEVSNLSDAEIENAINEINQAIQKYSRFEPGK
jgi:serine/threonine protein phosphatase PrpC